MYYTDRVFTLVQSALKSYGPSPIKRLLWNKEYSGDKWDFADHTVGDCVYGHLQRFAANGSVLDLGCGSGNTATELPMQAYSRYVGADISEVCLNKARRRSMETGRANKNEFILADFIDYVPTAQYDVILFRESLYHVPMGKIEATLSRYGRCLKPNGVIIVRMKTSGPDDQVKSRPAAMIRIIEASFSVVERAEHIRQRSTVIVFRPHRSQQDGRETAP
jgi:ubiquinone/menaquinone biosynthesis C-methylase UbiE